MAHYQLKTEELEGMLGILKAGDTVSAGQLIAACPAGKVGSDVHAPFGGKVTEAGQYIVIER